MSEENKALVRRFVDEFWNGGNLAIADELMTPDAAIYLPTGEQVDREGLKAFAGMWKAAFPDWHANTDELVGENDQVAERWTGHGTHRGDLPSLPATGQTVSAPGAVFYRIAEGKIAEFRGQVDM